ncbi:unnamed protein product [Caenorhabditis angaria]|uniref:Uncharacterized protein n=1 Tax=Caenorhabditis angaria TaxID=860376 RepID=A0A9P1IYZ9_9PELO|nr:unnamed protein product [Caenorhabditis angaria]
MAVQLVRIHIKDWIDHTEQIIADMKTISTELNRVKKISAISLITGSSIGVASSGAIIAGAILLPPVAIAGAAIGAASGVSNCATGLYKWNHRRNRIETLNAYFEKNKELFKNFVRTYETLFGTSAYFDRFSNESSEFVNFDKIHVAGAAMVVARGGAILQSVPITSLTALGKGLLHSIALVGIAVDLLTIAINAKELSKNSSLAEEIATHQQILEQHIQELRGFFDDPTPRICQVSSGSDDDDNDEGMGSSTRPTSSCADSIERLSTLSDDN